MNENPSARAGQNSFSVLLQTGDRNRKRVQRRTTKQPRPANRSTHAGACKSRRSHANQRTALETRQCAGSQYQGSDREHRASRGRRSFLKRNERTPPFEERGPGVGHEHGRAAVHHACVFKAHQSSFASQSVKASRSQATRVKRQNSQLS